DIAKIAIRSEQEHQAKRNAAANKRTGQAQLEQKRAWMRKVAETLQIDLPAHITLEVADAFLKEHRSAYRQAMEAKAAASPEPVSSDPQPIDAPPATLPETEPVQVTTPSFPASPSGPVETRHQPGHKELADTDAVPKGMMIQITERASAQRKKITKPTN